MRMVVPALVTAACFSLAGSALAQITLVHVTSCGQATFPGAICTIPATGSGNLLVVGFQVAGGNTSTTITSVTDNAGNNYTEAGPARATDTNEGTVVDIWYARNSTVGATSVTVTPSTTVSAGAVIWEFSGINNAAPLDATSVLNNQPSTTTPSGASVTTIAVAEVIVSIAEVGANVTSIVSGNPFTNDSNLLGNGWAHLITLSPGTYFAQWNQSPAATYASSTASFKAGVALNACDLNQDGVVNVIDVQSAVDMDLGLLPCTANIDGAGVCNAAVVNAAITAALGGSCVTSPPPSHSVTLNWTASTSSKIQGYNIYRGTVSGGPYTIVNTSLIPALTYLDSNVQAGQTYYYVATAVDINNNESVYSSPPAQAAVPTP